MNNEHPTEEPGDIGKEKQAFVIDTINEATRIANALTRVIKALRTGAVDNMSVDDMNGLCVSVYSSRVEIEYAVGIAEKERVKPIKTNE